MKLLLASAALLLAAPGAIAAPETSPAPAAQAAPSAEHLAIARQYVALVRPGGNSVEEMREGILFGAMNALGEDASDQEIEEAKKQVELVVARFEPILVKRRPAIEEAYALAYARQFSAAELTDLIAFASSPVGRKYQAAMGEVQLDDAVLEAEELMAEDMAPLIEDLRKASCAKAAAERVAMGDASAKCPLTAGPATAAG